MTPKEKAKELVDKFTVVGLQQRAEGYQCALIAVDEILNNEIGMLYYDSDIEYWQQVKQEIEKL
jgi:hypothetical protein